VSRLLRVELRRFRHRITLWLVAGGLVAVAVLTVGSAWSWAVPPTDEELAQRQQFYEQSLADWEEHGEEMVADCREQEAAARTTQPDVDFGCDMMAPRLEDYLGSQLTFADSGLGLVEQMMLPIAFAAGLMAASFVGAEASSGSLGTWLTFAPRRVPVYLSKLGAAVLGVLPPTVLALAVATGGGWAVFAVHGTVGDAGAEVWTRILQADGRLVVVAVVAAVLGVALAFLVRHTAAVLGVVVGWAVVVEGLLRNLVPAVAPMTAQVNLAAWASAGTEYGTTECRTGVDGMQVCDWVSHEVSMTHGGLLLAAAAVVVTVVSVLVLRVRDVS